MGLLGLLTSHCQSAQNATTASSPHRLGATQLIVAIVTAWHCCTTVLHNGHLHARGMMCKRLFPPTLGAALPACLPSREGRAPVGGAGLMRPPRPPLRDVDPSVSSLLAFPPAPLGRPRLAGAPFLSPASGSLLL